MQRTLYPRIKICCIRSREEARLAVQHGASALGLVSAMPSGPGVISEEQIAQIAATVPPSVSPFLLTSLQDAEAICEQLRRCGVTTVQICDRLQHGDHQQMRRVLPGLRIVQVIHVVGDESLEGARRVAPHVDAILLDSGNPARAVKELGGTGRTHDWNHSRQIREQIDTPVFLAGGLRADNVADAIRCVQPFAVDVCSGVRTNDRLDPKKLAAFTHQVRSA